MFAICGTTCKRLSVPLNPNVCPAPVSLEIICPEGKLLATCAACCRQVPGGFLSEEFEKQIGEQTLIPAFSIHNQNLKQ
eukprot:4220052-Amphidinium_carterae.1